MFLMIHEYLMIHLSLMSLMSHLILNYLKSHLILKSNGLLI